MENRELAQHCFRMEEQKYIIKQNPQILLNANLRILTLFVKKNINESSPRLLYQNKTYNLDGFVGQ